MAYRCDVTYVQPAQVVCCPTKFHYLCMSVIPYSIYFALFHNKLNCSNSVCRMQEIITRFAKISTSKGSKAPMVVITKYLQTNCLQLDLTENGFCDF